MSVLVPSLSRHESAYYEELLGSDLEDIVSVHDSELDLTSSEYEDDEEALFMPSPSNQNNATLSPNSKLFQIKTKANSRDRHDKEIEKLKKEMEFLHRENSFLRSKLDFSNLKAPSVVRLASVKEIRTEETNKGSDQSRNPERKKGNGKSKQTTISMQKEISLLAPPPANSSSDSTLYEMLQEYMVENENLRRENHSLHSQQDKVIREQRSLSTENGVLNKRLEDLGRFMVTNPWYFNSAQPSRQNSEQSVFTFKTYPPSPQQKTFQQLAINNNPQQNQHFLNSTFPPLQNHQQRFPVVAWRGDSPSETGLPVQEIKLPRLKMGKTPEKRRVKRSSANSTMLNSSINSPPSKRKQPPRSQRIPAAAAASNRLSGNFTDRSVQVSSDQWHPAERFYGVESLNTTVYQHFPQQQQQPHVMYGGSNDQQTAQANIFRRLVSNNYHPAASNHQQLPPNFDNAFHGYHPPGGAVPASYLPQEAYQPQHLASGGSIRTANSWQRFNDQTKKETEEIDAQISSLTRSMRSRNVSKKNNLATFP